MAITLLFGTKYQVSSSPFICIIMFWTNDYYLFADVRQWEYISYCLSQLGFTEKGMKKLIDSFKTYEHVVLEDSVMEHFKSIVNKVWAYELIWLLLTYPNIWSAKFSSLHILFQSKKFAKPELKLYIEEFEEKLNKTHMERKEQEVTARNAQVHQQRISNIEASSVSAKNGEDAPESEITEGWFNPPTHFHCSFPLCSLDLNTY